MIGARWIYVLRGVTELDANMNLGVPCRAVPLICKSRAGHTRVVHSPVPTFSARHSSGPCHILRAVSHLPFRVCREATWSNVRSRIDGARRHSDVLQQCPHRCPLRGEGGGEDSS